MGRFKAKQIRPLGEFDQKYGQKYWGLVHDSDYEVSFNLMHPVNIDEGHTIDFEEKMLKETKSGKEYLFLRKVRVNDSGPQEELRAAPGPRPVKAAFSKPAAASEKFLKDVSDFPLRVFTACLPYTDSVSLINNETYRREYLEFVQDVANELLIMTDNVRNADKAEAAVEQKPEPSSGYDKFKAAKASLDTVEDSVNGHEDLPEDW